MRVLLVSANREKLPSPVVPLGVLQVAGALRGKGRSEVLVLDLCFEDDPRGALRRALAEHTPDVVGLGLRNLHDNAYDGIEPSLAYYAELVAEVRDAAPRAVVVLGGTGFSLQPESILARLGADHGVVGEGEEAFPALLQILEVKGSAPAILRAASVRAPTAPRSLVRRGGGEEGALGLAATELDLDALPPPARDLVDPRYYAFDGTDNLQTKRGCAFQCSYCDYPDLEGRRVRVRDPEAVADELLARSRVPGVRYAFFVDSVFNVPRAHAIQVCEAIAARGSPLPWVCYVSPVAMDDEVAAAMARAGCVGAEIGSDTGTEAMLRRLHKPFRLRHIEGARQAFVKHGLLDCHTFVLGAEGETADEARETLRFAEGLDPDVAVFLVFMEDREEHGVGRAKHRQALLKLLAEEAPRHAGWVVPELGIRFGEKLTRHVLRTGVVGPSWLELARLRRRARVN